MTKFGALCNVFCYLMSISLSSCIYIYCIYIRYWEHDIDIILIRPILALFLTAWKRCSGSPHIRMPSDKIICSWNSPWFIGHTMAMDYWGISPNSGEIQLSEREGADLPCEKIGQYFVDSFIISRIARIQIGSIVKEFLVFPFNATTLYTFTISAGFPIISRIGGYYWSTWINSIWAKQPLCRCCFGKQIGWWATENQNCAFLVRSLDIQIGCFNIGLMTSNGGFYHQ